MIDAEFTEYKKGETIFEQGSINNRLLLLTEGEGKVFVDGVEVGRVPTNQIFGVRSALMQIPRGATIVCDSDRCFVMGVTRDQFHDLIREAPEVADSLIIQLIRVIEQLNKMVHSKSV